MANIRTWLEKVEEIFDEKIEAIVIRNRTDDKQPLTNTHLSREDGLKILDYEYDNNYSNSDIRYMFAWSNSRCFLIRGKDEETKLSFFKKPKGYEPSLNYMDNILDGFKRNQK